MRLFDLFEAIPLSQAKKYMKLDNSQQYDELFRKFEKYGRGDEKLKRLYIPIRTKTSGRKEEEFFESKKVINGILYQYTMLRFFMKMDIHPDIAKELFDSGTGALYQKLTKIVQNIKANRSNIVGEDYDFMALSDNYIKGVITLDGKNTFKIGKLLSSLQIAWDKMKKSVIDFDQKGITVGGWPNKSWLKSIDTAREELMKIIPLYQNDPVRTASQNINFYCVISRSPYDLAGMSTGRGWTSCTNLETGSQKEYVITYVANANLIAYLIKEGDWNLQHPAARQLICRYNRSYKDHDTLDHDDFVFWPQETYGSASRGFDRTVQLFCKIANKGKDDGMFAPEFDQQYTDGVTKQKHTVRPR